MLRHILKMQVYKLYRCTYINNGDQIVHDLYVSIMLTQIHTCLLREWSNDVHTYICTYIHIFVHTYTHTRARANARMHTCAHAWNVDTHVLTSWSKTCIYTCFVEGIL